jgi:aminoglycoside phosphotransferase (APT) family kinase protein
MLRLWLPEGPKVMKLGRPDAPGSVRKELALIERLRAHGIPVPAVEHADAAGREHGRAWFVMSHAGDRTLHDLLHEPGETPRRLLREMGEVHARIHEIALPAAGTIHADGIERSTPDAFLAELRDFARTLVAEGHLAAHEADAFEALPLPDTEGTALCHGDFHTVQCVVRRGRIEAVVDWEAAWAGNPAVDVAVTQAYLDFTCPASLRPLYEEGYRARRALPGDHEAAYRPVRAAQVVGLLRAWRTRGEGAWESVRRQGRVERAIRLFRRYASPGG